jgi:uncharacterized UPF0160 family protein
MEMDINKKKLITHDGSFHADDIFAAATFFLFLEKRGENFEIIRTRDSELINKGDYVFDVGGIYDEKINRFDHHQKGGAGKRENGIEYSSFGLVWKHFGINLCDDDINVWNMIDFKIVAPIDAVDNGIDIVIPKFKNIMPYGGEQPFLIFSPTWQESKENINDIFKNKVEDVKKILRREIEVAKADSLGKKIIEDFYKRFDDKRIIILEDNFPRYLYQETLSSFQEPMYVIYPNGKKDSWKVEAIQKSPETMESRKLFPEKWRGLLDNDLRLKEITGVSDVIFCHKNGFLITTISKEGAIALAQKALQANETIS